VAATLPDALLELDPVKLPARIDAARNAVLERMDFKLQDSEQVALRRALSTLDNLQRITESQNLSAERELNPR